MKMNLLIVFLLLTGYSWGQSINLVNKTVSNKNSKTIYIGVENEFTITGENKISVQPQWGVSLDQNKLKVRATSVGELTILFITDKDKIPIAFNVARVPDPIPVIGRHDGRQINKNILLADNAISLKSNNENSFFYNYDIISFSVKFRNKTFDFKGNKFSTEILTELNNANTGDALTIASFVARNDDLNKTINVNSNYTFNIK